MTAVDRVKAELKKQKIAVSRMEKDLGFGNAYIAQLKKGTIPADRLDAIAKYLNVSYEYLLYGEEKSPSVDDELVRQVQLLRDREDLRGLLDVCSRRTPEQIQKMIDLFGSMPEG